MPWTEEEDGRFVIEASEFDHMERNEKGKCPACGSNYVIIDDSVYPNGVEMRADGEIIAWHGKCGRCETKLMIIND
jgi:hypothetical protein